jgi:hypothetical protein
MESNPFREAIGVLALAGRPRNETPEDAVDVLPERGGDPAA